MRAGASPVPGPVSVRPPTPSLLSREGRVPGRESGAASDAYPPDSCGGAVVRAAASCPPPAPGPCGPSHRRSWWPPATSLSAASSPPRSSSPAASPTWSRSPHLPDPDGRHIVYAVTGELFFASSNDLVDRFDYADDPDHVIIDLSGAHIWDASSAAALDAVAAKYADRGKTVEIVGLNPHSARIHRPLTGELVGSH